MDGQFEPCIQCGVRSYAFVTMPFGLLTFCMHHYGENWPSLEATARFVHLEAVPA